MTSRPPSEVYASSPPFYDVAIVGAGAVGLCMALACHARGLNTVLVGPISSPPSGRSVALFVKAIAFLKEIGVWEALEPHAYPLKNLRIIDDTPSLFRPPAVTFQAREVGLEALGYSFELSTLIETLAQRFAETSSRYAHASHIPSMLKHLDQTPSGVHLTLDTQECVHARLVIAADGRNSFVRKAAGIAVNTWTYPQVALTVRIRHTRDHENMSTEMHTRTGPFTWVPLGSHQSGIVWLTTPEHGEMLRTASDTELACALREASRGLIGDITTEGPRQIVPMQGLSAHTLTAQHIALVGETAHAFPPIGAQGLNMGLADCAVLFEALSKKQPINEILSRYERARHSDIRMRTGLVDVLNRALLSPFLPVDLLRGAGLLALGQIGSLRRIVMKTGLR
jgi:2-octaprenyl-6-methoxyphenol hydroxylase